MEKTNGEEKICLLSSEEKPVHQSISSRKGVNEAFEKVASYGLLPNMIFYLMNGYHMNTASGSTILLLWSALSNAMAIVGAFLSDAYLGRFRVIAIGSFSSLLGMTLLWLTAVIPRMKPSPCDQFNDRCSSASPPQLAVLFSSFGLMSIGAGCIRPCSIAFGADQLDDKKNPNNTRVLETFFSWYYASTGIATILALTIIVYIQEILGWAIGLGVPVILMVFSALMFIVGSSLYVKVGAGESLFVGFAQVLVAAYKNRNLSVPDSEEIYHRKHDSAYPAPTDKLRCLNKACIIRNPARDLSPDGSASDPWSVCTVDQVESLKALLVVIPMWSANIMLLVSISQGSFATLQANTMNRHITQNFKIPAGSFSVFMVITITIWVALYDRVIAPLLIKHTGRSFGSKTRMGIGLAVSFVALILSAITEGVRRRIAIEEGLADQPNAATDMSAMWLVPQYMLFGLAEAFNAVGQIEFYYSQFPKSMSSIAVALLTLGMAISSLFGTLLVNIVDSISSKGGKESWFASNINKGHLDYYFWLLAVLCLVNFVYFLACCWSYGPSQKRAEASDEIEEH